MAIDTAAKRLSVQGYGGGASAVMPLPIGASTAGSRADVVWLYSGLKYAAASTVDTHDGLYAHEPRYVPSSERARRRRREKEKLRRLIEEAAEPRREPAAAPVEVKEHAEPRPRRAEPKEALRIAARIAKPRTLDLSGLSGKLDALVASREARARTAAEKAAAERRLAEAAEADRRAAEEAERARIRAEEAAKAAEEARRLREHNRRVVMLLLAA